jgi:hypothetical protein
VEKSTPIDNYSPWIEMGVLDDILGALARDADLEWLMIDSPIVRAHQQAASGRREKDHMEATDGRARLEFGVRQPTLETAHRSPGPAPSVRRREALHLVLSDKTRAASRRGSLSP